MDLTTEERLFQAFVKPRFRGRYLALLHSRRGRPKIIERLSHSGDLDERYMREVPKEISDWTALLALLSRRGAPPSCYIVSEDSGIDGQVMDLGEAVRSVYQSGMGTIISCLPGRLAYYEAEYGDESSLLERDLPEISFSSRSAR